MPPHFRAIVTLYHLEGMSYGEIAEVLNLPEGTVKSHLFRGRKLLRERLAMKYRQEDLV
jgi:RNA polymerase sigma-70 factor (ECF subfamily)